MLVSMKEILEHASRENYGVIAPNVFTDLEVRAALEAAEELKAPMIINIVFDASPDIESFGKTVAAMANTCKSPVAINLDHGGYSQGGAVYEALTVAKAGFTSVMIDRSSESFEENVRVVKEVVDLMHPLGISVEAEIGHVGRGLSYETDRDASLTDPLTAKAFLEQTGVDCLAVAVGTAHGSYGNHKPFLDFERIVQIKQATGNLPLVLHGGSGTGYDNLSKACTLGINKINICNELLSAANEAVVDANLKENGVYDLWSTLIQAWKDRLKFLMDVAGCVDKAFATYPKGYVAMEINKTQVW